MSRDVLICPKRYAPGFSLSPFSDFRTCLISLAVDKNCPIRRLGFFLLDALLDALLDCRGAPCVKRLFNGRASTLLPNDHGAHSPANVHAALFLSCCIHRSHGGTVKRCVLKTLIDLFSLPAQLPHRARSLWPSKKTRRIINNSGSTNIL